MTIKRVTKKTCSCRSKQYACFQYTNHLNQGQKKDLNPENHQISSLRLFSHCIALQNFAV